MEESSSNSIANAKPFLNSTRRDSVNENHVHDRELQQFSYQNGMISADEYNSAFKYFCEVCNKGYTSVSGLYYHSRKFDHKNPPKDFNPSFVSKRGRPKGFTPKKNSEKKQNRQNQTPKKLTYEESQRVVEVEQHGCNHIIPLDQNLELIFDEESEFKESNQSINKKAENTNAVFSTKSEYGEIKSKFNQDKNYFHPKYTYKDCIEYQMDEEDVAWCEELKNEIDFENHDFEKIVDSFERYSEFIKSTEGEETVETDDIACAVCLDGDCSNNNAIVFCDICNIAVHQDCYGVPFVPEGPWVCRRCSHAPSKEISCVLCPIKSGVMKQTVNDSWCHLICAILMPGVFFSNTVFLDAIDVSGVSHTRFKVECKICQSISGAVIQCYEHNCTVAFHASCAQMNGWLTIERVENKSNDENSHSHINHRYIAFCSKHLPQQPQLINRRTGKKSQLKIVQPLVQKSTFVPATIHVPVVPEHLIESLNNEFSEKLVSSVKKYWQIKRYMRSGVPILRRRSYIPRNSHFNIKIDSDIEDAKTKIITKLKDLNTNLTKVSEILSLMKKREELTIKLTNHKKTYIEFLFDDNLFDFIFDKITKYFHNNRMKIKIDKNSLKKLFDKNLGFDFNSFVVNLFGKYFHDSEGGKENKFLKMIKERFLEIFKEEENIDLSVIDNIDIVPANTKARELVKTLTQDLKRKCTKNQIEQFMSHLSTKSIVWANYKPCKFPAIIHDIDDTQENTIVNVKIFGQANSFKSLSISDIEPLGLSAEYDENIINKSLDSRSFGRKLKKQIFRSYAKAINHLNKSRN